MAHPVLASLLFPPPPGAPSSTHSKEASSCTPHVARGFRGQALPRRLCQVSLALGCNSESGTSSPHLDFPVDPHQPPCLPPWSGTHKAARGDLYKPRAYPNPPSADPTEGRPPPRSACKLLHHLVTTHFPTVYRRPAPSCTLRSKLSKALALIQTFPALSGFTP